MDEFTPAPVKAAVTVADLEKLDIRVGTILAVEDVPKSSKLLRLTVDLGDHRRTILASQPCTGRVPVAAPIPAAPEGTVAWPWNSGTGSTAAIRR